MLSELPSRYICGNCASTKAGDECKDCLGNGCTCSHEPEWVAALKEYAQLREEIGQLEESGECSCNYDEFHRCQLCESTGGLDSRATALMNLWADTWAMRLFHNDGAISRNFPKPCGICKDVIQSKEDTEWHGYGNCRDIPEAIMNPSRLTLADRKLAEFGQTWDGQAYVFNGKDAVEKRDTSMPAALTPYHGGENG